MRRIINIFLRLTTLVGRFLLVFSLVKILSEEDYASYGIFAACVGYAIYFVGLDFYTYSTRKIIGQPMAEVKWMLQSHLIFGGLMFFLLIPLFYSINKLKLIGDDYFIFFIIILGFEYINQEFSRILTALGAVLEASLCMFFRSGIWSFIFPLFAFVFDEDIGNKVYLIFVLWIFFGLLSLVLSIFFIKRLGVQILSLPFVVDWGWVGKGIRISVILLIPTLALRGILTFDKFYVNNNFSIEQVAAYIFLGALAAVMQALLDAAIFSFSYPSIVKACKDGDKKFFIYSLKKILKSTLLLSVLFSIFSIFIFDFLLNVVDKSNFAKYFDVFLILLLANIILAISMIPHYAVYSMGLDWNIFFSHITGFFIFLILLTVSPSNFGFLWMPISLCIAFFVVLIVKLVGFYLGLRNYFGVKNV